MWITEKEVNGPINLDKVGGITKRNLEAGDYAKRPEYNILFWDVTMTHYLYWLFSDKQRRDNTYEHIKRLLNNTEIDGSMTPMRLE